MLTQSAAAEMALARAEWQRAVFAERPGRVAMLELEPRWPMEPVRISVLRNHAAEPALTIMRPFLAYAGLAADVTLSGYDDSLSAPPRRGADVHLVWLDPQPYSRADAPAADGAVSARLRELRGILSGPLLLVDAPARLAGAACLNDQLREAAEQLPDVHVFPYAALCAPLGGAAIESRQAALGTHVSGDAALITAQHLGLQWIPAMVRPRLKAVVVDLDDTIVGGVLGEDGARHLVTGGGYLQLRERLLRLHEQGVLLALVTRNDGDDVERLFSERAELSALRRALSVVAAGWGPKSESVRSIAARFRVGLDSVLVVDDNPGEVAAMAASLHDPWFIVARDPASCARALALHPGLLSVRSDELGSHRARDLAAADRRAAEMHGAAEPSEYLRSLRMVARFSVNAAPDRSRLSELSRKTNQFNTSLARYSETDVHSYMTIERRVVSIRLRDRLSDSGLIGAVFARRRGDDVVIEEIAISCRALGRSIEARLLDLAIARIVEDLGCARVVVRFVAGARNAAAREWLSAVGRPIDDGWYEYRAGRADARPAGTHGLIEVQWDDRDGTG